jgi:hypothetical protein
MDGRRALLEVDDHSFRASANRPEPLVGWTLREIEFQASSKLEVSSTRDLISEDDKASWSSS